MTVDAPAWLAEFQARFGEVIRTPLDRASGTLTAQPSLYDARVVDDTVEGPAAKGAAGLAVYNRQYWARLFDVLQSAFPLTARLLGYWTFNGHAARFLLAHPPSSWDLDRVPDGFEDFFANTTERGDAGHPPAQASAAPASAAQTDARTLIEAARIDAAWRAAFTAPRTAPFRPSTADAARLLDARLVPSRAVHIVEEHRALLELRRRVLLDRGEHATPWPAPLARSQWWAIAGSEEGVLQRRLEAREAQLLVLLAAHPVRRALAELERDCPLEERAQLPERTRAWLAQSVQHDFWSGIHFD
jgi:hypothetical protein